MCTQLSYSILIEVRNYLAAQVHLLLWKVYLLRWRMKRELKRCDTEVLLATMAFIVRSMLPSSSLMLTFAC